MKVPLRFQNTEYDCGTTTFINALAYLFDREEISVTLIKKIYQYTLDVENNIGIIGAGGTSVNATEKLTKYISRYANTNDFNIKCELLEKDEVSFDKIIQCIENKGVVIARCYMEGEHYVLITNIDKDNVYLFDPYFLPEDYYKNDKKVNIVLFNDFKYNRIVSIDRFISKNKKDFALVDNENKEVILINKCLL